MILLRVIGRDGAAVRRLMNPSVRRLVARVHELISVVRRPAAAVERVRVDQLGLLLLVVDLLRSVVPRVGRAPAAERERLLDVLRRRYRRCGGGRRSRGRDLRRRREPVQRINLVLVRLDGAGSFVVRSRLFVAGR